MQKTILNVIRLLLLICTICNAYITYLNLYPWMTGDYSAEIQFGTLGCMVLCFLLYCLVVNKTPCDIELPYRNEKRTLVFTLPLSFLIMNIILEAIIWGIISNKDLWIGDEVSTKFFCIFLVFIIIGVLFYISMKNQIYIWYPISLYCTIYAVPGGEYAGGLSGAGFIVVCLAGAAIFSIIEYGIMLFLNRKKLYISKEEK